MHNKKTNKKIQEAKKVIHNHKQFSICCVRPWLLSACCCVPKVSFFSKTKIGRWIFYSTEILYIPALTVKEVLKQVHICLTLCWFWTLDGEAQGIAESRGFNDVIRTLRCLALCWLSAEGNKSSLGPQRQRTVLVPDISANVEKGPWLFLGHILGSGLTTVSLRRMTHSGHLEAWEVEGCRTDGPTRLSWNREDQFTKQCIFTTHMGCTHHPNTLIAPFTPCHSLGIWD